jgi:hypothetical protein
MWWRLTDTRWTLTVTWRIPDKAAEDPDEFVANAVGEVDDAVGDYSVTGGTIFR